MKAYAHKKIYSFMFISALFMIDEKLETTLMSIGKGTGKQIVV